MVEGKEVLTKVEDEAQKAVIARHVPVLSWDEEFLIGNVMKHPSRTDGEAAIVIFYLCMCSKHMIAQCDFEPRAFDQSPHSTANHRS